MSDLQNALKFKAELLKTYISGAIKNAKKESIEITNKTGIGHSVVKCVILHYMSTQFSFQVPLYLEEHLTKDFSEFNISDVARYSGYYYDSDITNITLGDIISEDSKLNRILFSKSFTSIRKYFKIDRNTKEHNIYFGGKDYVVEVSREKLSVVYHINVEKTTLNTIKLVEADVKDLPEDIDAYMKKVKSNINKLKEKHNEVYSNKLKELVKEMNDYKETI